MNVSENTSSDTSENTEAITAEMIRQMFINSPLRTLRGYLNYSKEQMDDLMAKLEQALKQ